MGFPTFSFTSRPDFIQDISFPIRPFKADDNERGGQDIASMRNIGDRHYKTKATFYWDAIISSRFYDLMQLLNAVKNTASPIYLPPDFHPFEGDVLKTYLKQTGSCFYFLDGEVTFQTIQADLYRLRVGVVNYPLFIDIGNIRHYIYSQREYEILDDPIFISSNIRPLKIYLNELEKDLKLVYRSNCINFELVLDNEDLVVTKFDRGQGFNINTVDSDKRLLNIGDSFTGYLSPYDDPDFRIPLTIILGATDGVNTGSFSPLYLHSTDSDRIEWNITYVTIPPVLETVTNNSEPEAYLSTNSGDYIVVTDEQYVPLDSVNPIPVGFHFGSTDYAVKVNFDVTTHIWGTPTQYTIYRYSDASASWGEYDNFLSTQCPKVILLYLNTWIKFSVVVLMPNGDEDIYWSEPIYIQEEMLNDFIATYV